MPTITWLMSIKDQVQKLSGEFANAIIALIANSSMAEMAEILNSGKHGAKAEKPSKAEKPAKAEKPTKAEKVSKAEKPTKAPKASRTSSGRRASDSVESLQAQVVDYIKKHGRGGLAISEVAKGLDILTETVVLPIRRAVVSGEIVKTGERRNTRYFPKGFGDSVAEETDAEETDAEEADAEETDAEETDAEETDDEHFELDDDADAAEG